MAPKSTYRHFFKCPKIHTYPSSSALKIHTDPFSSATYMPTTGPFWCFKQATESVQNPEKLTKTSEREREISTGFLGFPEILTLNVKMFVRSVDLED